MSRKSRKALFEFLRPFWGPTFDPPEKTTSFEAYGRDVRAYVTVPEGLERPDFERKLREGGFEANSGWNSGSERATEVRVSYFKAWHWDV